MSEGTKIEWTDATWSPVRARFWEAQNDGSGKERIGWHCEHVSEGCRHCYAERINQRLGTSLEFKPGNGYRPEREGFANGEAKLFLDQTLLTQPLRWKRPRMIFVCSMTDLFAEFVPDDWIDQVFAVMALCPQHTFQVLTKRPERMRDYLSRGGDEGGSVVHNRLAWVAVPKVMDQWFPAWLREGPVGPHRARAIASFAKWPLPNVWLGVSAEDQAAADARIPALLETPAVVRFVSLEPLLGPINLMRIADVRPFLESAVRFYLNALTGHFSESTDDDDDNDFNRIDWVIVGGESGAQARSMHPAWVRSLRDQCAAADVPFFFKQWGEWIGADDWFETVERDGAFVLRDGKPWQPPQPLNFEAASFLANAGGFPAEAHSDGSTLIRVGKKAARRLLDGVVHDGMPGTP